MCNYQTKLFIWLLTISLLSYERKKYRHTKLTEKVVELCEANHMAWEYL